VRHAACTRVDVTLGCWDCMAQLLGLPGSSTSGVWRLVRCACVVCALPRIGVWQAESSGGSSADAPGEGAGRQPGAPGVVSFISAREARRPLPQRKRRRTEAESARPPDQPAAKRKAPPSRAAGAPLSSHQPMWSPSQPRVQPGRRGEAKSSVCRFSSVMLLQQAVRACGTGSCLTRGALTATRPRVQGRRRRERASASWRTRRSRCQPRSGQRCSARLRTAPALQASAWPRRWRTTWRRSALRRRLPCSARRCRRCWPGATRWSPRRPAPARRSRTWRRSCTTCRRGLLRRACCGPAPAGLSGKR